MNIKGSLFILFTLFASLSFATYNYAPSCYAGNTYTVAGATFIYTSYGGTIGCTASTEYSPLVYTMVPVGGDVYISPLTATQYRLGESTSGGGYVPAANTTYAVPMSQFTTTQTLTLGICTGGLDNEVWFGNSTVLNLFRSNADICNNFTGTYNGVNWNFTNTTISILISPTDVMNISTYGKSNGTVVNAYVKLNHATKVTGSLEPATSGQMSNQSGLEYISAANYTGAIGTGTKLIRSDIGTGLHTTATSSFCQTLLYFNSPFYGNIQLIPKLTYVPSVDVWADFINTSGNSAFIPNNTITYVFDSVTSAWYIVPATICTNYGVIGSTTTLQYNPTATTGANGGSVPIDVNAITGSCSYATSTRVVTCNGTDTSNTVTSMSLSGYLSGNTTDLCAQTASGASAILSCTLPNRNGTYYVIFYGTDANLFNHQFAYRDISILGTSTGTYGRDAFLAMLLIFGMCALVLSNNMAISMIMGCFGLFVGLAFGIIPLANAPIVVLFTVVALVIAYKMKV
jgi:hypothetical protein